MSIPPASQEPTKICSKCQVEKPISKYFKNKKNKDGLRYSCKDCERNRNIENSKKYNIEHKEEIKLQRKQYRLKNKKKLGKIYHQYYLKNKEECKLYAKQYWKNNREKNILKNKEYSLRHEKEIKEYRKQHYADNKKEILLKSKKYQLEHKIELRNKKREYEKQRYKNDINYKITCICRRRIGLALKNNYKSKNTISLIGCSIPELRLHLEKQWQPEMTWNNWGYGKNKWHIDHIIPCAFFDMSDAVEQHMCFRWQNLQPLWQSDNLAKSDKVIPKNTPLALQSTP